MDVNAPYKGLEFHYVYQLIMGGLVFLIIPGQYLTQEPVTFLRLTNSQASVSSTAVWPVESLPPP